MSEPLKLNQANLSRVNSSVARPKYDRQRASVGIAAGGLGGLVGGFLHGWLQTFNPALHAAEAKRAA